MKVADRHREKPMESMFAKEPDAPDAYKNEDDVIRCATASLRDHHAIGPYSCQLCHIEFLTRRELQLHVMCHGMYIRDETSEPGSSKATGARLTPADEQGRENRSYTDKEPTRRKSPVIQRSDDMAPRSGSSSEIEESQQMSPTYGISGVAIDQTASSKVQGESTQMNGISASSTNPVAVNCDVSYGKIVDVLSLATATRGFKEPGSIWCSLCKCTVDKGHICKVHQTSYHAEKTEEGFTCELCGRYYNQKRKLRTHLRNRHKGFRLQEDEGYMCWQCWQAFPEIKILEEHIVTVHGHESRRQNSTWRPFTNPSTQSPPGEPSDDNATGSDVPSSPIPIPHTSQTTSSLKRPGDGNITSPCPAKKPTPGHQELLSVGEVNGKVVVNDSFMLTTEVPNIPQSKSPISNHTINMIRQSSPEAVATRSTPQSVVSSPSKGHSPPAVENSWKTVPFNQPNYPSGSLAGDASTCVTTPSNVKTISPAVLYPSNCSQYKKKGTAQAQRPQQCPHCSEKFSKKYILQLHIQQNHGENMHCFFCATSCGTKEALSLHIKNSHPDEVKNGKCPICQCKCLGELHQHIVQYHVKDLLTRKDKDRVLSTCPICHQTTTDAYHLRWHILKEHQGYQAQGEPTDGSIEETSSESGSSVTSEGRFANEVPDRMTGIAKDVSGLSNDNTGTPEERTCQGPDGDEIEIVFVSDRNLDPYWSKRGDEKLHRSEPGLDSGSTGTTSAESQSQKPIPSVPAVHSIKTPADSSGTLDASPKLDQGRLSIDQVHSTTGHIEPKDGTEEASPNAQGKTTSDYLRLSEEACIFCFTSFNDKENLVSHLRSAHGWVETFTCPICRHHAAKYPDVVEHFCVSHFHPTEETLTQAEAKCLKCDIIFQDIAHLKKHSAALHSFQLPSSPTYNTFKCRHCNIIFEKQFDAQKHFDVYHLFRIRYKCESCRMGFTAKHDFQEHVTCNHPELIKSFCPLCGLGFEVNSDLEEHVFDMHRRKAQFFCAQCGNEFADRFHVHMHIRSNCCVRWADSNFECLDCLTAFSSISELRIHCNQGNCKPSGKK